MNKAEIGKARKRVLKEWKNNPLRTVREFADALGMSLASVSGHLCALEREGFIQRKRLSRTYKGQSPGESSRDWNVASVKGAELRMTKPTKRNEKKSREQELIDKVVAKAQANGTAWTGGAAMVMTERLSGCKVG